jgi:predicted ATPase/class 3 adenylate cyclase
MTGSHGAPAVMMPTQPAGDVSLLFSDIEAPTRLLRLLGNDRYTLGLEQHRQILRQAFAAYQGYEVNCEGDSFFVAFPSATGAVAAAADAQRALAQHNWADGLPVRVRIGIHTGQPTPAPPKYVGLDVHRAARVMSAAHGGQVLVTASTRELNDSRFSFRDLGEHALKDIPTSTHLYQLEADGLESDFPPLRTLANRPTNLPSPARPILGRTEELARLAGLLGDRQVRLVTVTGAGGVGKTRLGLEAAAAARELFPAGVFLVNLAPVRDGDVLVRTIAQTLNLRERPQEPLVETLGDYLQTRELLLMLDNFEQIAPSAAALATLLERAPRLKLLVTSRVPLHLAAERVLRLGSLELPPAAADEQTLRNSAASALFLDRIVAADPEFELTTAAAPAVAELCVRLGGLPLALELAAARALVLSPQDMLARLEQHLPVLGRGAVDLPERQRTIEATIAWSYDLLDQAEQQVFARLGVFVGGWSFEAAEDVCAEPRVDILDVLESLVENSLVVVSTDRKSGDARFAMLEIVREFALRRLEEAGADDQARSAVAWHLRKLAGDGPWHYYGPDQIGWVARAIRELDNARAVMNWAQASSRDEIYVALAAGLWPAMYWLGAIREAGEWLSRAMTLTGVPAALRLTTVSSACVVAGWQGTSSEAWAEELAETLETALDPQQRSLGFLGLTLVATVAGDSYAAKAHSLALADAARGVNPNLLLVGLHRAAGFAIELDELDAAQEYVTEALETARAIGAGHSLTWVLITSGTVSLTRGDAPQAAAQYAEAVDRAAELGLTRSAGTLRAVHGLACCSVAMGHSLDVAARLLASTETQCTKSSWSFTGADAKRHTRAVDLVRAAFDEGRLRDLWAEGTAMDAAEASDAALRLASELLQAPTPSHSE